MSDLPDDIQQICDNLTDCDIAEDIVLEDKMNDILENINTIKTTKEAATIDNIHLFIKEFWYFTHKVPNSLPTTLPTTNTTLPNSLPNTNTTLPTTNTTLLNSLPTTLPTTNTVLEYKIYGNLAKTMFKYRNSMKSLTPLLEITSFTDVTMSAVDALIIKYSFNSVITCLIKENNPSMNYYINLYDVLFTDELYTEINIFKDIEIDSINTSLLEYFLKSGEEKEKLLKEKKMHKRTPIRFNIGDIVGAQDKEGKWWLSRILNVCELDTNHIYLVEFCNWGYQFNEILVNYNRITYFNPCKHPLFKKSNTKKILAKVIKRSLLNTINDADTSESKIIVENENSDIDTISDEELDAAERLSEYSKNSD